MTYGGTLFANMNAIYDEEGEIQEATRVQMLSKDKYQAVIVPDFAILHEPCVQDFVAEQYQKRVTVVVPAIEGIFDLSTTQQRTFGVSWRRMVGVYKAWHS
jgi:hypothetical protein